MFIQCKVQFLSKITTLFESSAAERTHVQTIVGHRLGSCTCQEIWTDSTTFKTA